MTRVPLLSAQGLNVRYGAIQAVRGIELSINEGEIVTFLGANGAGKSSTLNALVGLVPVAEGRVLFDDQDITDLAPERLTPMGLTLAPEGRRVFGGLTVEENLLMGAYAVNDVDRRMAAWDMVYDLFPILHERRKQFAGTLSGGQQQMLAIGRALMCGPRLLLLDEPSLGLAPKIVGQIFDLIALLRERDVTLGIVEQNVAMALEVADRGYVMAAGRVVATGTAEELRQTDRLRAAYLGEE